ncbi:MAG TPA: hypothetical protein VGM14_09730 [Streptosporangiaceae bacterium]
MRRYQIRSLRCESGGSLCLRCTSGRAFSAAAMLAVVVLAPVVMIAGEPLRRYCQRRFGHRDPARAVLGSALVMALTAPGRWVIDRRSRSAGHIGRRRGPGDERPPSDLREPRRPLPTAPAGAIALAEPRLQQRVIPIRKSLLSVLSDAVRRTRRRLRQTAALPGRLVHR